MVDARGGMPRHVHAAARHHDHQRRTARHPERRWAPASRGCSGSSTPTRSRLRRCCSQPAAWPTSTAAASSTSVGLIIFLVASLMCGFAADTLVLQLSRGLQGVGGAVMFSVSLALLASAFPVARTVAPRSASGAPSPALPSRSVRCSAARLTSGLNMALDLLHQPADRRRRALHRAHQGRRVQGAVKARKPDVPGFVLFTLALVEPGRRRSSSPTTEASATDFVIGGFVAAAVLLVAVFVVTRAARGRTRCSSSALFRKPTFTGGAIAAFGHQRDAVRDAALPGALHPERARLRRPLQTGLRLLVLSGGHPARGRRCRSRVRRTCRYGC